MLQGIEQSGQLLGAVRPIGVHLDQCVIAARQPPVETREVCTPEPLLARAVEDMDVRVRLRHAVGQLSCAVRGVVVGDQDVGLGHRRAQATHDQRQVLRLVVRRDDDQDPADSRHAWEPRSPSRDGAHSPGADRGQTRRR